MHLLEILNKLCICDVIINHKEFCGIIKVAKGWNFFGFISCTLLTNY